MTRADEALQYLQALIATAVGSGVPVEVEEPELQQITSAGYVALALGEPPDDEPELLLGFGYQHERIVVIRIFLASSNKATRFDARRALTDAIVTAIESDRRLGGLVDYARLLPPDHDSRQEEGTTVMGVTALPCEIAYTTTSSVG